MTRKSSTNKELGLLPLLDYYPQLSWVRDAFKNSSARVFLVGGAMRDYYLNAFHRSFDFDFAVDKEAIALSRKFARRIKGAFVLLDDEHGSARIVKKRDGLTWTFDFTDWRGTSIEKDLSFRDFTVNALAMDILGKDNASILEVKESRRDLKAGVVRMVSPQVFEDDPLRLLRAFTLHATLGFKIEAKTLSQIKKDAHLISKVSAERIREDSCTAKSTTPTTRDRSPELLR